MDVHVQRDTEDCFEEEISVSDFSIDPATGNIVDQTTGCVMHVPTSEEVKKSTNGTAQKSNGSSETASVNSGDGLIYLL